MNGRDNIIRLIKLLSSRIKKGYELRKYTDFSIAEYFKKQGAIIGESNRIEVRSLGPEPYLIKIGSHCTICQHVTFVTHDGGVWIFTEEIPSLQKFGSITILDNCFIGIYSIIMGNVTIGPNSIIGAGSVVTKDVPPNKIVGGNPARVISTVSEYKEKAIRSWSEQKPPRYFMGLEDHVKYPPEYIQQIKFRDQHLLKKHLINLFRGKE